MTLLSSAEKIAEELLEAFATMIIISSSTEESSLLCSLSLAKLHIGALRIHMGLQSYDFSFLSAP